MFSLLIVSSSIIKVLTDQATRKRHIYNVKINNKLVSQTAHDQVNKVSEIDKCMVNIKSPLCVPVAYNNSFLVQHVLK